MSKVKLLSSCGAAALLAVSAGAAFAQSISVGNVSEYTVNYGPVYNSGWISVSGIHGDGSSVSISATGAASAVSLQSINGNYTGGGKLKVGNVKQTTKNFAPVRNYGTISGYATGVSGHGASASVSATGAQSAVSLSRIGGNYYPTKTKIGSVKQYTLNYGNVTNTGTILNTWYGLASGLSGNGSSVSVSATGAASAVSVSSINTGGSDKIKVANYGRIKQTTKNRSGYVINYGFIPGSYRGDLSGHGASASVSATGAASSVSVSRIASAPMKFVKMGRVKQHTSNSATVINKHSGRPYRSYYLSGTMSLGDLSGTGSSASISATGAASSVSYSSLGQRYHAYNTISIGGVKQQTYNSGDVTNMGPVESRTRRYGSWYYRRYVTTTSYRAAALHVGDLKGAGSSVSVSATGAASAVSLSKVNDKSSTSISVYKVAQGTFNFGDVTNFGRIYAGNLTGNGASASISATGAVSSVSYSNINSGWGLDSLAAGPILQGTVNKGDVTNVGGKTKTRTVTYRYSYRYGWRRYVSERTYYTPATMHVGHLKGAGTSASIGATGAASSVSYSAIGGYGSTTAYTHFVLQGTLNKGNILNLGRIYAGNLYGAGSSVSVAAMGAASSVAISKIDNKGSMYALTGPIIQGTVNTGYVTNNGVIYAGSLYGNGSSASVSATGAASAVSLTRINGGPIHSYNRGIAQLTINLAPVSNYGRISVGNIAGHGASASVSASGAVSQVANTSICYGCTSSFRTGPVYQATLNTAPVTNQGTIYAGRVTGAGASASVSALGAGSVVSGTIISKGY